MKIEPYIYRDLSKKECWFGEYIASPMPQSELTEFNFSNFKFRELDLKIFIGNRALKNGILAEIETLTSNVD